MDDDRHVIVFPGKYDRYGDETSFGEDDIRFQIMNQLMSLPKSFEYAEGVGKILDAEIAAQFT